MLSTIWSGLTVDLEQSSSHQGIADRSLRSTKFPSPANPRLNAYSHAFVKHSFIFQLFMYYVIINLNT